MSAPNTEIATLPPVRVGVVLADLGRLNVTALKYLVVHLNTLQTSIEFEFLSPDDNDPLLRSLAVGAVVDRDKCREMLEPFREPRFRKHPLT